MYVQEGQEWLVQVRRNDGMAQHPFCVCTHSDPDQQGMKHAQSSLCHLQAQSAVDLVLLQQTVC